MEQRIGFDLDGVLVSFHRAFISACGADPRNVSKWVRYPFSDCPNGLTPEETEKVWEQIRVKPTFWRNLDADSVADILRVAKESHRNQFYFITHRPPQAFTATAQWLADHEIQPAGLIFEKDKRKVCSGLHIEAFLDDFGDVINEFDGYKMQAYLLNRPWNREITYCKRVDSVGEFLDKVLEG